MSDTPVHKNDPQPCVDLSEIQKLANISKRMGEINTRLKELRKEQDKRNSHRSILEGGLLSTEKINEWSDSAAEYGIEKADVNYAHKKLKPLSILFIILYVISLAAPLFVVLPRMPGGRGEFSLAWLLSYVIGFICVIYLNPKPSSD